MDIQRKINPLTADLTPKPEIRHNNMSNLYLHRISQASQAHQHCHLLIFCMQHPPLKKSDTARSERSRMEINFGHSLCNPALPIQIESSPPIHTSGSERALFTLQGRGGFSSLIAGGKNPSEYRMTGESGRCALISSANTSALKCSKAAALKLCYPM